MHYATLKWSTPNGDDLIAHMARVSNPKAKEGDPSEKLIRYLITHRHWSPFEMANMCVEILTTRDIGRQVLRHRSFSFQEFSGRYAAYEDILEGREFRLQDSSNRQNSIEVDDHPAKNTWDALIRNMAHHARQQYEWAISNGVAKEQARALLPEGLVPTRMYMNGTVRSWIHYLHERTQPGVQKEHRMLALSIQGVFALHFPQVFAAIQPEGLPKLYEEE